MTAPRESIAALIERHPVLVSTHSRNTKGEDIVITIHSNESPRGITAQICTKPPLVKSGFDTVQDAVQWVIGQ